MTERRPLIEGIKLPLPSVNPQREQEFVHGTKALAATLPANSETIRRVPISTRIRAEFAAALKKASLQRQLDGAEPSKLQDILEEAIEPWLRNNNYIR
jgi:hypothetical protein